MGNISRGRTRIQIEDYFASNEISWLRAWYCITSRSENYPNLEFHTGDTKKAYKTLIKDTKFCMKAMKNNLKDVNNQKLTLDFFKHYNKKRHEFINKPIMRPRISVDIIPAHDNTEENWRKYWKKLTKIQTQNPGILEYLQRFNLGHYEHKFHAHIPREQYPYAQDPNCCLCEEYHESFQHIFQDCFFAQQIWKEMDLTGLPTLSNLHLNLTLSSEEYIQHNQYIEFLWKLRQKRRYTTKPHRPTLQPSDITQLLSYYSHQQSKQSDYSRY